ncbi:MAG: flagellar biosynthesis protein FlhF [Clostridiaceae bacterium]|nr:flagellar biosynthesis protein FlhF [Eubacteriales bacterium]
MFVKSYIVKDMSEAMEKIRRELGPEAVILSNREIKQKGVAAWFKKPLLEVMVAYEPAPDRRLVPEKAAPPRKYAPQEAKPAPAAPARPAQRAEENFRPAQFEKLSSERAEAPSEDGKNLKQLYDRLSEIKGVVADVAEKINTPASAPGKKPPQKLSAEVTRIYETLVEHDVHFSVARKLARQTQELSARVGEDPSRVAQSLILETLGESAAIRLKKYRMNVIALVGPTGVGKTTTLVKLAGLFTIDQNLKVGLINTDTYRVAAQEQIRTYAEIMDIPLHTLYAPEETESALSELDDRDVVLIDTAGKSMANKEYAKEIEAYVSQSGADEVLLTVSASMGFSACKSFLEQFAFLKNAKLVVTKLDEVASWGNVLNIAYLAQRPIAYVTMGQNVPYDIERFDARKAVANILESTGM